MKSSVSVIIPCYCCAETVERAVDSVVNQSLIPTEIILVDDFSPDEGMTLDKLHNIKNKFQDKLTIKLIELKINVGPGMARNYGWEVATQDYIAFLDADDVWHPKKLAIQYEFMIQNPDIKLSGHRQNEITDLNAFIQTEIVESHLTISLISPSIIVYSNPLATRTVMLSRSLDVRFRDKKRYSEDYLLWMQIILKGNKAANIDANLAASFKPAYGASGLSSHMWKMEAEEIKNFYELYRTKLINIKLLFFSVIISLLKFLKRKTF